MPGSRISLAIDVGDRHLGGRVQEQIVLTDRVHVAFQLGQLPVPNSEARRTTCGGDTSR
jgi:hypothetical protein